MINYKLTKGVLLDTDLDENDWDGLIVDFKRTVKEKTKKEFPQNVYEQLLGAGDAFNAGLTVALSEGKNIIESLKFANCCGAFTCTKAGVVNTLAYRHEIDLLYNDNY